MRKVKGTVTLAVLIGTTTILCSRQNPVTSEVHRLYVEDQRDRGVGSESGESLPWEETESRARARRQRVHELLALNTLKTAEDFHDAAFIYQHGQTPADYLLAHVMATGAVQKGDARSLWISAATLDRYLNSINQPQVFGTQYNSKNDGPSLRIPIAAN